MNTRVKNNGRLTFGRRCSLVAALVLVLSGCPRKTNYDLEDIGNADQPQRQHGAQVVSMVGLPVAMVKDSKKSNAPPKLRRIPGELDTLGVRANFLYDLNEWKKDWTDDDDWLIEPLYSGLSKGADLEIESDRQLSSGDFGLLDFYHIRQAIWLRDIAEMVMAGHIMNKSPKPDWFSATSDSIGEIQAEELLQTAWLFDWTVQNIRLEQDDAPELDGRWLWENLLLGKGSANQRARIFIRLTRQIGLDAVMLGLKSDLSVTPQPWAVGVMIGNDLYLFDARIGLPIPGPDYKGIATLAQAMDDPKILEQLNSIPNITYPVTQTQLKDVTALIDVTGEDVSHRSYQLESNLPQPNRRTFFTSPMALKLKLRDCKGIADVQLWRWPNTQRTLRIKRAYTPEGQKADMMAMWLYEVYQAETPLFRGRMRHFRGDYYSQDNRQGAKELYLSCQAAPREVKEAINYLKQLHTMLHLAALAANEPDLKKFAQQHASSADFLEAVFNAVTQIQEESETSSLAGSASATESEKSLCDRAIANGHLSANSTEQREKLDELLQWIQFFANAPRVKDQVSGWLGQAAALGQNQTERENYYAMMTQRAEETLLPSNYSLGIIAIENGQPEVANDYLIRNIVNKVSPGEDAPFINSAYFNMGRVWEDAAVVAATDEEKREKALRAIEHYESQASRNSPQRLGDLLRARMLREKYGISDEDEPDKP